MRAIFSRLLAGLRALINKEQADRDLDDELQLVSRRKRRPEIADGASRDEALRTARARLGSIPAVKDYVRDVGWESWLHDFWQDVRYALRGLRRTPGFAITAIAALTLGIGAAVTIFSVMHTVLWRPLAYPDSNQLIVIDRTAGALECQCLASGELHELRTSSRTLTAIGTANGVDAFLTVNGEHERVAAASSSDDMLSLLGAVPLTLGRPLDAALDTSGGFMSGVVISHRLWARLFGSDPGVIGRHVQINNRDVQIVGVSPASLRVWLPSGTGLASVGGLSIEENVDVWLPLPIEPSLGATLPQAIARLAPGVSPTEAQAELDLFAARLITNHPEAYAGLADGPMRLRARSLRTVVGAPVERELVALGAAVGFVLLIALINVANLLLARTQSRDRELATRAALGAGRVRLVRQLMTESLVLAAIGGGAGVILAQGGIAALSWLRPVHLPRQSEIAIDWTVTVVAVALSVVATVVCSLVPSLRLMRAERPGNALRTRGTLAPAGGRRLQRALVVAEIALSIVPLLGAGLMLRSFANLTAAPLGFDPEGILTARVPFSARLVPDEFARWTLQRDAIAAVGLLPGVEAVSAASPLPFSQLQSIRRFRRDGDPSDQGYAAASQSILPNYLRVMGTPLLQGREFTDADIAGRRNVAIVDQRFADALWGGDAIGRRFRVGSGAGLRLLEVIGVTPSIRVTKVRAQPLPHVFLPYHLNPVETNLVIRTRADAATLGPSIKRAVEALGTLRAVHDIRPMSAYVADSIADTRFTMWLLMLFAGTSLLLAGIGLYGTLAYLTSQRTQEFGVRLALGATSRDILTLVAGEGMVVVAIGALVGTTAAVAVAGLLQSLLYGVDRLDPATLLGVVAVLAVSAAIAIGHPAVRASRVNPMSTLRAE